jgi:hypothetical protein
MGDMEIKSSGFIGKAKEFYRKEVKGEEEGKKDGTWSNASTMDYVARGATTGAVVGAAAGFIADRVESSKGSYEVVTKTPIMEKKVLGEIPSNHISDKPDIPSPEFVKPDGKPVSGRGVKVYGEVPKRNILGQIQFDEKKEIVPSTQHGLLYHVLGGIVIGAIGGTLAAIGVKMINEIIHPTRSEEAWQGPKRPEWKPPTLPEPPAQGTKQPWSRSAPAWDNSHNKAPWDNTHNRSHSNYSDAHQRSHSNYSNAHYRSHSNYSDTHNRSHSNYSNAHSNTPSWDRRVDY